MQLIPEERRSTFDGGPSVEMRALVFDVVASVPCSTSAPAAALLIMRARARHMRMAHAGLAVVNRADGPTTTGSDGPRTPAGRVAAPMSRPLGVLA